MFALPPDHTLGDEIRLGDFRVRAIDRFWADEESEIITLHDAMRNGRCIIRESGMQGWLTTEVTGERPVLVLCGDLLFGGTQDRLAARSVVLEPGFGAIPVFAAETWRWPAGDTPWTKLMQRDDACPAADLHVRAALLRTGEQAAVRASILEVATDFGVKDAQGRGAYRCVTRTPHAAEAVPLVSGARKLAWAFTVGFVVYHGDRLIAADLFENTVLLAGASESLLHSYALTALFGRVDEPEAPAAMEREHEPAGDYDAAPPQAMRVIDDGELIRRECRRGKQGKPVHTSVFRR